MVAWMRWINIMALERIGNKGHLSMEGNYAQVQVQRGAQNPNQRAKTRKTLKRKSCENQGVTDWSVRASLQTNPHPWGMRATMTWVKESGSLTQRRWVE